MGREEAHACTSSTGSALFGVLIVRVEVETLKYLTAELPELSDGM